jgi:hypothetical protein
MPSIAKADLLCLAAGAKGGSIVSAFSEEDMMRS